MSQIKLEDYTLDQLTEALDNNVFPPDTKIKHSINRRGYTKLGDTPLIYEAVKQRSYAKVALLLQHGANTNAPYTSLEDDRISVVRESRYALQTAIYNDDINIVELLLNNGADVSLVDTIKIETISKATDLVKSTKTKRKLVESGSPEVEILINQDRIRHLLSLSPLSFRFSKEAKHIDQLFQKYPSTFLKYLIDNKKLLLQEKYQFLDKCPKPAFYQRIALVNSRPIMDFIGEYLLTAGQKLLHPEDASDTDATNSRYEAFILFDYIPKESSAYPDAVYIKAVALFHHHKQVVSEEIALGCIEPLLKKAGNRGHENSRLFFRMQLNAIAKPDENNHSEFNWSEESTFSLPASTVKRANVDIQTLICKYRLDDSIYWKNQCGTLSQYIKVRFYDDIILLPNKIASILAALSSSGSPLDKITALKMYVETTKLNQSSAGFFSKAETTEMTNLSKDIVALTSRYEKKPEFTQDDIARP